MVLVRRPLFKWLCGQSHEPKNCGLVAQNLVGRVAKILKCGPGILKTVVKLVLAKYEACTTVYVNLVLGTSRILH